LKAIFILKIEHINASEEGLAGEQSALASVANYFEKFFARCTKKFSPS
jgi:hypothetical protein